MQRPAVFASLLAKPDPTNWDTITYTYDPAGRRIKKNVVGSYIVKYVYAETHASNRRDGDHVIAEYDDSGLLRKYIYGARVDEPVCMLENPASDGIDVADNNAAYYYHFDGLGSVVALSNSNGDSCQSYEYSAYGQVAASDPNFLSNPYMFTGRRFDVETGLYYYRARYYNPHIGRFMQTDPVGYSDGINWYLYCNNNPLAFVDPSGSIQMATGNYVTMPGNLYPGKAMAADVLSAVAGLVANVIELSEADKDPRVAFIKKMYLEALKDLAEVIPTIQNKNVWSAFIEVYDSNDPNDKYWIEVRGFRMPGDNTACWTPGGGYESWGQAADAGGSLAKWALDNGGAIPEYVPPGWFAPDWDGRSPYITGVPRKASSQFLNAINTTNKLIDKVQEIKDKIDKIIKED